MTGVGEHSACKNSLNIEAKESSAQSPDAERYSRPYNSGETSQVDKSPTFNFCEM